MEGKEVRFGVANSALWATVTTDTSCGAVNSMHDSYTPLGGMVPLANMMLSEVVFGGVGSGMYGMIIFIILAVFIAGLMVGRTPEYMGKKIEAYDVKMAMLVALIFPLIILTFTSISVLHPFGTSASATRGRTDSPRSCMRIPKALPTMAPHSPDSAPTHSGTTSPSV
jgi:K+-transporting ATPase ATPase A chain